MDTGLAWLIVPLVPGRRQRGGSLHYLRGKAEGSLYGDNVTGGGVSAPPVGPSQLLHCNWIPALLSSRLPALFEVISSAGKERQRVTEWGTE